MAFCLVFSVFTHQQASISDSLNHNISQSFGYNNPFFLNVHIYTHTPVYIYIFYYKRRRIAEHKWKQPAEATAASVSNVCSSPELSSISGLLSVDTNSRPFSHPSCAGFSAFFIQLFPEASLLQLLHPLALCPSVSLNVRKPVLHLQHCMEELSHGPFNIYRLIG